MLGRRRRRLHPVCLSHGLWTRLLLYARPSRVLSQSPTTFRTTTDVERFGGNGQCWRASRACELTSITTRQFLKVLNLVGTSIRVKSQKDPFSQIMTVRSLPFEGPRDKRLFVWKSDSPSKTSFPIHHHLWC